MPHGILIERRNHLQGVIGGLLAFGLLSSSIPGIASWRVLFLVEGLPAVALGVLVWRLLPGKLEEIVSFGIHLPPTST
jgi:MFS family permease